jgi:hypothetical protein
MERRPQSYYDSKLDYIYGFAVKIFDILSKECLGKVCRLRHRAHH